MLKFFLLNLGRFSTFYRDLVNLKDLIVREEPDLIQSWMYHSNLICSVLVYFMRLQVSLYWNIRHSNISLTNDKMSLLLVVGIGALWSLVLQGENCILCRSCSSFPYQDGLSKQAIYCYW